MLGGLSFLSLVQSEPTQQQALLVSKQQTPLRSSQLPDQTYLSITLSHVGGSLPLESIIARALAAFSHFFVAAILLRYRGEWQ